MLRAVDRAVPQLRAQLAPLELQCSTHPPCLETDVDAVVEASTAARWQQQQPQISPAVIIMLKALSLRQAPVQASAC